VLSADLTVDVFFWLSAFLGSYKLLMLLKHNDGNFPCSKRRLVLDRFIRLAPLYYATLFFFWQVMVLMGGAGPLFFEYKSMSQCGDNWLYHVLFINNLVPWKQRDMCMGWTWYIACEMQFFLLLPVLVQQYYKVRDNFWISIGVLAGISSLIVLVVICKNEISASYFTYKDAYWTVLYEKPYSRMMCYLVGVCTGCTYFTHKHENEELGENRNEDEYEDPGEVFEEPHETNMLKDIFIRLQSNSWAALIAIGGGLVASQLLVFLLAKINSSP